MRSLVELSQVQWVAFIAHLFSRYLPLIICPLIRAMIPGENGFFFLSPLVFLAVVVNHADSLVTQLQHACGEVVRVTEFFEPSKPTMTVEK